jgi:hypothetical protein
MLPEGDSGEVPLFGRVPLGGEEEGEALTGVRDEARLVGDLTEHVGGVTISGQRGCSTRHKGGGSGNSTKDSATVLNVNRKLLVSLKGIYPKTYASNAEWQGFTKLADGYMSAKGKPNLQAPTTSTLAWARTTTTEERVLETFPEAQAIADLAVRDAILNYLDK